MKTVASTLILISFTIFSCKHTPDNSSSVGKTENKNSTNNIHQRSAQSTFELLQGKWQSIEDTTNFLLFENDHRKEIAGGLEQWDDEVFVVSDKCVNDVDQNNNITPEKDRYITCINSNLCWYIDSLDNNQLELVYMARGNSLSYKRVK